MQRFDGGRLGRDRLAEFFLGRIQPHEREQLARALETGGRRRRGWKAGRVQSGRIAGALVLGEAASVAGRSAHHAERSGQACIVCRSAGQGGRYEKQRQKGKALHDGHRSRHAGSSEQALSASRSRGVISVGGCRLGK